jgi:ABC-type Fe3+ transport system substrate-binding protein
VLQPLPSTYDVPADLNGVPLRSPEKMWVGAATVGLRHSGQQSVADRDGLPLPKTWADLANPAYRGRIELADPRRSGSAHTAYEIILQTNGWEKGWQVLTAMAANASSFKESSSALLQDVQGGQAVFAPAIDFYAATAVQRANGKLVYITPQKQYVTTPDPIGVSVARPIRNLHRSSSRSCCRLKARSCGCSSTARGRPQKNHALSPGDFAFALQAAFERRQRDDRPLRCQK